MKLYHQIVAYTPSKRVEMPYRHNETEFLTTFLCLLPIMLIYVLMNLLLLIIYKKGLNCNCFLVTVTGVLGIDRKLIRDASARLVSENMWSVGATVRYLLISGLISELVWFCKSIGDLKTSLSISLLVADHHKSIKHIKR